MSCSPLNASSGFSEALNAIFVESGDQLNDSIFNDASDVSVFASSGRQLCVAAPAFTNHNWC